MSTTVRVNVTTVAAVALALTGSAHAQARAADSLVVLTEWLATHLTDPSVVVVEVVHEPGARGVHIAGSRAVNYRSMTVSRDGLGTELPSPDSLKVLFEGLGISSASPVGGVV